MKLLLNWSPEFTIEEGLKETVEWVGKMGIKLSYSFTSWPSQYRNNFHNIESK